MIYCVSDIHGDYRRYRELLDRLSPGAQDTLYVLGDVVDRGPDSMRVLLHMMRCSNIRPLVGNHEYMALRCLRFLTEEITEETIGAHLYTAHMPDPDLIIRPSGEIRTSNFLLWQSAYAEYYFTPTLWPDYSPRDVDEAVAAFYGRKRRFGGL